MAVFTLKLSDHDEAQQSQSNAEDLGESQRVTGLWLLEALRNWVLMSMKSGGSSGSDSNRVDELANKS